jgi:hypothetical protein
VKKWLFVNCMALGLLGMVSPGARASINLVSNGGFETGSPTAPGTGAGSCSVPGWTCTVPAGNVGGASNNVGLWTVAYGGPGQGSFFGGTFTQDNLSGGYSPDLAGNYAVYLVDDGVGGNPITESISQSINVVAGQTYDVGFDVFYVANSTGNGNGSTASLNLNVAATRPRQEVSRRVSGQT